MASFFYLMIALLVQSLLIQAGVNKNVTESVELVTDDQIESHANDAEVIVKNKSNSAEEESVRTAESDNTVLKSDDDDLLIKDFRTATNDWVDMFLGTGSDLYPSTSVTKMNQATNSNKSPEEQLEEIKEVASEITMAIQSEMANLLSYALNYVDKDVEDNKLRKRRSIESPTDSSQLVMRLLKHIKSNNEYQNIAIEKMMSAQEISDKFGVEFSPDPEILSDLAFAANEQAKELTSILQDACYTNNSSCVSKINRTETNQITDNSDITQAATNITCNELSSNYPDFDNISTSQVHEHTFPPMWDNPTNHYHYIDNHAGYNYYESQIASPPVQHSCLSPVSSKPTFYDSISYNPNEYSVPYCSVDPMAYFSFYPFDEPLDLEPELVGEEYEETLSSKMIIEQDEDPGFATVNHIMTYTVSEKAHFKTPQIEKLPQQLQYYFLLM